MNLETAAASRILPSCRSGRTGEHIDRGPVACRLPAGGLPMRAQSRRLVSGNIEGVKVLENGRIAINLMRYMDGKQVLDSATVPAGKDPMGRPWHTAVHVREDSKLYAALEAA
jgi:hypothetical protein